MKVMLKRFFAENKTLLVMLTLAGMFIAVLCLWFGLHADWLQIATIPVGIIALDLGRRQRVASFFFNFIFCALLIYWFIRIGLYGQVAMRSFIAVTNIAGIYFWLRRGPDNKTIRPTHLASFDRIILYATAAAFGIAWAAAFGIIGAMDFVTAGLATVGLMLLTKKKFDSWIIMLTGDILSVFLFLYTGEYIYLAFLGCAIYEDIASIIQWGREIKETKIVAAAINKGQA